MKHKLLPAVLGILSLISQSSAQNQIRMPDPFTSLMPSEKQGLKKQAASFFHASKPAIAIAAKSTVSISYQNSRISYGTIVNTPRSTRPAILTKWSEIKNGRNQLVISTWDGKQFPAKVSGVYPDHDLALLQVDSSDAQLTPIKLKKSAAPALGSFILMARPDGNVEGIGVVSVSTRSLREDDKAYLGVMMNPTATKRDGAHLEKVMPGSAAQKAGLRKGDLIISVDQTAITGPMEMRNTLQRLIPGSKIIITYQRANAKKKAIVRLGSRAENTEIRRVPRERMERMQRMGTIPSRVRSNFPSVIQSDMPIDPRDAGAPVTDLDGNIVGITIARGSRIKTFIIPTSTIRKVLGRAPRTPGATLTTENKRSSTRPDHQHQVIPSIAPANEDPLDQVRRLLGK